MTAAFFGATLIIRSRQTAESDHGSESKTYSRQDWRSEKGKDEGKGKGTEARGCQKTGDRAPEETPHDSQVPEPSHVISS